MIIIEFIEISDGSEIPVLSQHLTPSKWSSYIPDFSSSQKDEVNCEVLWDFSSPNAVRHLRSNIISLVSLF